MAKNFISDLSTTAASNTDIVGQDVQGSANVSGGDNALRNYGSMLAKFYDDLGGVNTVGGTADAITVTAAQGWTAYGTGAGEIGTGTVLAFKAGAANTGAATINVNAIGTKKIRRQGDSALSANDIVSGGTYILKYDSAYDSATGGWVLLNPQTAGAYQPLDANLTSLASGAEFALGQIYFPATQNPSVNVNVLDDYEEGTWTPGLTFGGSAAGITYSGQTGTYIKVGSKVFVTATITLTNNGSGTGAAIVTGLPFTTIAGAAKQGTLPFGSWSNTSGVVGNPVALTVSASTTANIYMSGATGIALMTDTNITDTAQLIFSGCYTASA